MENETELEMAKRHERENASRIERQKQLVADMEGHGLEGMLPFARKLLQEFEAAQEQFTAHRERVERAWAR